MSDKEESSVPKITKEGDKIHVEGIGEFESTQPHSLFLTVQNLQISNVMQDLSDEENPKPPQLKKSIHGDALVDRDLGLGVIGYEDTHTKKLSIEIRGLDENEIKEMSLKRIEHYEDQAVSQDSDIKKILDFSGSEKIYTFASLGFTPADWELDIEDNYFLSIYLTNEFFDFLSAQIKAKTIGGLTLGLDIDGLYTNDNVPFINRPIRFNFLPSEKEPGALSMSDMRSPPMVHGFVSMMGIYEKKQNFTEYKPSEIQENLPDEDLAENYESIQGEYAALLKQILPRIDALNKTTGSIKKAIWVAVFIMAVWAMSVL